MDAVSVSSSSTLICEGLRALPFRLPPDAASRPESLSASPSPECLPVDLDVPMSSMTSSASCARLCLRLIKACCPAACATAAVADTAPLPLPLLLLSGEAA
jgi:hypothetical protein